MVTSKRLVPVCVTYPAGDKRKFQGWDGSRAESIAVQSGGRP